METTWRSLPLETVEKRGRWLKHFLPLYLQRPPSGKRSVCSQWKRTVEDDTLSLNSFTGQTDEVLIKFVYNPKGGNNVYIDDINLNVTIGVEEWTDEAGRVALYPNPAMDYFTGLWPREWFRGVSSDYRLERSRSIFNDLRRCRRPSIGNGGCELIAFRNVLCTDAE